jgi:RNA polymerase sigma factor (sigma-70 family)
MAAIMELDDYGTQRYADEAIVERTAAVRATHKKVADLSELELQIDDSTARDEELRHAMDLREAREELVALFQQLPPEAHVCIVHDGPTSAVARERDSWPLEFVESCYERLVALSASKNDAELAGMSASAVRLKTRIDRAREALVMSNLYIVPHIVKRFRRGTIPFVDLVQEGRVGLIKAVDRYDPDRGYRFSTYAYWWIRRSLSDAFTNRSRLIRLPDSLREDLRAMRQATTALEEELGRRPSLAELAERMEIPERKVKKLLGVVPDPSSLEEIAESFDEGWGAIVAEDDTPDPLERTLAGELRRQAGLALEGLEPREREIIRLRFGFDDGEGLTLSEIGKQIGLSRERVRQIERGALTKLHGWASTHAGDAC